MINIIWPLLILVGVLFVLVFDLGNGLSSPGFWLIPIGVIGTIVATVNKAGSSKIKQPKQRVKWLVGVWALAFLSIAGLYFGWFSDPEGFGALNWILPAIGFTVIGLIMSVVYLVRK